MLATAMLFGLAGSATARAIHLPPMAMPDALLTLARQTGRNILFAPGNVAGLRTHAVDADDFASALRQMTQGTPLRIVQAPGGALMLVPHASGAPHLAIRGALRPLPGATHSDQPILVSATPDADPPLAAASSLSLQSTLSAADIRRLPDRTAAEALGRLPGVLTLSTSLEGSMGGIDHAARAEGDFIALRGLNGGYIETRIDGIALPQSLPYSRGTELGLLPADGFTRISVVKMLGPDHAGDADAGVIDISGPDPRDPAIRGLHVHGLAALDQRALYYRQDAASIGAGFTFAGLFADDQLAVTIGADYARRAFTNAEQTYQSGNLEYAVTDAAGNSAPGLDPARNLMLTSVNAQITRGASRDITLHGAVDVRATDRLSLFAKFSYADEHTRQDVFQIGFQGGRDASYLAHIPIGGGLYRTQSVKSELHYWFETNPESSRLALGQIGAHWRGDRTDIVARAFAASGDTGRPDHLEISFWSPQASGLSGGLSVAPNGRFPMPVLTPQDEALLGRALTFPVHDEGERQVQHSQDRRLGGDIALSRTLDLGPLRSLDGGIEFVRSRRSQSLVNLSYPNTYPADTTLGQTGLTSGSIRTLLPGTYDYPVPLIDDDRLATAFAGATAAPLSADDINGATIFGHERRIAIHGMARLGNQALEVEPGIRMQLVHIANIYWISGNNGVALDGIDYGWNRSARSYRAILPSILARWRPLPGFTLRAGLWRSQSQPADYQLSGGTSVTLETDGDRIVEQGNPRLKAVDADNADWAVEWRGAAGASASFSAFAKHLDHYLYDMGSASLIGGTSEGEGSVEVTEPHNGGSANITGLEFTVHWPLASLTPLLRGWSLGGEATLLRSRVHLDVPLLDPVERAQYAPGHAATLRLAYARDRLSADAALDFVGAYVQQYGLYGTSLGAGASLNGSAIDDWVRPSRRLDLSIAYAFDARTTLRLMVRNALDDIAYRATLGRSSDAVPETVVSGRLIGMRFDRAW
ncbi:TonB-dependent receptor domain-containing protein [Sphingomonas abietis]|uniref:TonB-dependent receptor n=1 Tax=Sphingomonas abietis TaxID=3012344 RepID=A0ABY7NPV4_9SPHN|nr:TonB-dependent receptor [Sphingomonas abietis]WBO22830.1 TonB-dependent receptor [Sphingomonas abietis]